MTDTCKELLSVQQGYIFTQLFKKQSIFSFSMSNSPDSIKCFVCLFQVISKVLSIILLKNVKQLTTFIQSIVRAYVLTCHPLNCFHIFLVNYLQGKTYWELFFFKMFIELLVVFTTTLVYKFNKTSVHPKHCCPLDCFF